MEKTGAVSYAPATIIDAPRFGYRGSMLDIARHFQPVEFVKKYINLLALHNINRFHWHLTDDQGWRIQIEAYPKLTEVGSLRKETVIGRNSGEYDGIPHGGFYTKEELKEIVAYAQERYITVIPEVDLPDICWQHWLLILIGMYRRTIRSRGIMGGNLMMYSAQERFHYIFLEAVLTEVMEIFHRSISISVGMNRRKHVGKNAPAARHDQGTGTEGPRRTYCRTLLAELVTARMEQF